MELLSASELAKLLKVSTAWVFSHARSFPHKRVGRNFVFLANGANLQDIRDKNYRSVKRKFDNGVKFEVGGCIEKPVFDKFKRPAASKYNNNRAEAIRAAIDLLLKKEGVK